MVFVLSLGSGYSEMTALRMLVGAACAAMCLALIGAATSDASWGFLILWLALAYMSSGWVDKGLVQWLGRRKDVTRF